MTDKFDKQLVRISIRDFPLTTRQWLKIEAAKRNLNMAEFLVEVCEFWKKHHEEK